jgi:hypothetical protein
VGAGEFAIAREFIDSITDPQLKDCILVRIARSLVSTRDFTTAREFIDLITDSAQKDSLLATIPALTSLSRELLHKISFFL